jgi:hypothetical protein
MDRNWRRKMSNKSDENKKEKSTTDENPMKTVQTTSIPTKLQYSEDQSKKDAEKRNK